MVNLPRGALALSRPEADPGLLGLANLEASDYTAREISERPGEWMYVFTPEVAGMALYLKLILGGECVVISFHQQGEEDDG